MRNLPIEQIVAKIKEKSHLDEESILKKIDLKLKELSGLISQQGAAHIVANEYGVNLYEQSSGKVKIKELYPGLRGVDVVGKVQRVFEVREFNTGVRQGKVGSFTIGDETGVVRIVLWNDQADKLNEIKENEILLVENAYVRDNQGRKELHLNDKSNIKINPEGVGVVEVKQFTSVRKKISDLAEEDKEIELLGTIVQVFEPRFFEVCPKCNKRARAYQEAFVCEEHQKITPDYSYVLNLVLDDGSLPNGTIRAVFFRNQVERLLNKNKDEMMGYRDNPEAFGNVRNDLLGEIIKVVGRVNKNDMYDRLEFVTQLVFNKPNPEEEIKRLEDTKLVEKEV